MLSNLCPGAHQFASGVWGENILKSAYVAAAVGALLVAVPSLAQAGEKVDMAELTCKQFLADQEGLIPTAMWIDGYLSHQSGNTVIDIDELVNNVKQIADSCAGEPDKKIIDMMPADE